MSDNTAIEWADRTWNPLLGCERVSPGCDACYAINTATIRAGNPHPKVAAAFAGLTERRHGRLDWTGRINLLPDRMNQPLSWRKPQKVFVNSQSDLFHKDVPDDFIARVFAVMALTPRHSYQLLTKRHGRMRSWLNNDRMRLKVYNEAHALAHSLPSRPDASVSWPLSNLWLGVSVEDQKRADLRIPALLETPAAVRWLSMEPLLGPVDLGINDPHKGHQSDDDNGHPHPPVCLTCSTDGHEVEYFRRNSVRAGLGIDWVVVGGESGPRARPMHPHWARELRNQCASAGIPFFFKQWGEWAPTSETLTAKDPRTLAMHPRGTTAMTVDNPFDPFAAGHPYWEALRRWGKREAARELGGCTWDEYPIAAEVAAR